MKKRSLMDELTHAFTCLPSVGPKSAQRMVMHLLERNREGGIRLSEALVQAMEGVMHCEQCRNFTENPLCEICSDQRRDPSVICVVETPADVIAVEQAGSFRGHYFVLMGHLSPLDGIGPDDIGLTKLIDHVKRDNIQEIILATNSTVEGEATAHYIADAVEPHGVQVTRIAQGVPMGGELEYVDSSTLAHALAGRKAMNEVG